MRLLIGKKQALDGDPELACYLIVLPGEVLDVRGDGPREPTVDAKALSMDRWGSVGLARTSPSMWPRRPNFQSRDLKKGTHLWKLSATTRGRTRRESRQRSGRRGQSPWRRWWESR